MNFNVYLDEALARRLAALAKRTGARRNALIRQAVASLVARTKAEWPGPVLEWDGDPTIPPFEALRIDLGEPTVDPFAPSPRVSRSRQPRATKPRPRRR
jgi:hypothetical protein